MLTCLECAKLRGKPASSRFVEVVSEGVCPDCGRTLSRELMGVRLDAAPKVVLVSSLAVEADIVDGQAKIFGELASEIVRASLAMDDGITGATYEGEARRTLQAITEGVRRNGVTLAALARTMTNHAAALRKASEP